MPNRKPDFRPPFIRQRKLAQALREKTNRCNLVKIKFLSLDQSTCSPNRSKKSVIQSCYPPIEYMRRHRQNLLPRLDLRTWVQYLVTGVCANSPTSS